MERELRRRVRVRVHNGLGVLTLARPQQGNALDLDMARAFAEGVDLLAHGRGIGVVRLDAMGQAFCVGGDLAEFAAAEDPSGHVAAVAAAMHEALTTLRAISAPVVAVVQGVAAGGGLGLALAADLTVMARSARVRSAYTAVGLTPDCGVSHHLAIRLGPARALDLVLTNRSVTAQEALDWGLVSRVEEDDALQASSERLVQQLLAGSNRALVGARDLIRAASATGWSAQLAAEAASIARLAGAPDGREGVQAFHAKRPAMFARVDSGAGENR